MCQPEPVMWQESPQGSGFSCGYSVLLKTDTLDQAQKRLVGDALSVLLELRQCRFFTARSVVASSEPANWYTLFRGQKYIDSNRSISERDDDFCKVPTIQSWAFSFGAFVLAPSADDHSQELHTSTKAPIFRKDRNRRC